MSSRLLPPDGEHEVSLPAWRQVPPSEGPASQAAAQQDRAAQIAQIEQECEQRVAGTRAAALKEGEAAGRARAAAKLQPIVDRLARSIDEMAQSRPRPCREAETGTIRLALAIARRVPERIWAAAGYVARGGLDFARRLLTRASGPDRLPDRPTMAPGSEAASLDAIRKADPQQLARFIHNEHPQTIAAVISQLHWSKAAALLSSLPLQLRADVALRMASLDRISPAAVSKIVGAIGQKLKIPGESSRHSYGGVSTVAEILSRMDSEAGREIVDCIEERDANLGETIRHLMFVFEDLLLLDPQALKDVLGMVGRKLLTVALKGTSEQLKNCVLSCMSQRGAEMLRQDMEALGPMKVKEVAAAQQQILAIVRQLEAEGVISLKGTLGEQYVV